jgi:hypothetical protein
MKDPDIMEHKLVNEKEGEFTGYTILHITTSPKVIAKKVIVSLDFVGEIRVQKKYNTQKISSLLFGKLTLSLKF